MMERFLKRISLSEYKDKFILKDGMLVAAMVGLDARATMDLDATIKDANVSLTDVETIISKELNKIIKDKDLKKSYQEAKSAIDISNIMTNGEKIYFYESLGIYSLITQINNGKFLDSYVESKIGKLIKMDKMQEGDLCDTLETYLEHNCNANATSEALFIHRNTMRYRMDKIKKILDDDINNMSVLLELKLAFAIKHYRDRRDG